MENEEEQLPSPPLSLVLNTFFQEGWVLNWVWQRDHVFLASLGCVVTSYLKNTNKTKQKLRAPQLLLQRMSVWVGGRNRDQMTKLFCGNIHVAPDGVLVALSVDRPGASSATSRPVPCAHQEHAAPSPSPVFIQVPSPQQAAVTSLYRTV